MLKNLPALAFDIASEAHSGQSRKKLNIPYIVHPCRVASLVAPLKDDVLTAVAFLHDVLEDCDKDKKQYFIDKIDSLDYEVLERVIELTYSGNSKQEKEDYIKSFRYKSDVAFIIKVADRLDNIRSFIESGDYEYAGIYARKAAALVDIWNTAGFMHKIEEDLYGKEAMTIIDNYVMEIYKHRRG